MPRLRAYVVMLAGVLLLAGCTAGPVNHDPEPTTTTPTEPRPRTAMPADIATVIAGVGAAELAIATSQALFNHAPAVVLAAEGDKDALSEATSTAVDLGVPLLLVPGLAATAPASPEPSPAAPSQLSSPGAAPGAAPGASLSGALPLAPVPAAAAADLRAELTRLAPRTIVTMGESATSWARDPTSGAATTGTGAAPVIVPARLGDAGLPDVAPAPPLDQLLVLALNRPDSQAAAATARAAGARMLMMREPDPRADDDAITELARQPTLRVAALGSAFGPAELFRRRVETAATGKRLPGGGQVLFPGRRMVALYGHPGDGRLGVLGEQPVGAAIARAKRIAASYSSLVDEPVVPTFEIIATVASSGAGSDGNYSNESSLAHLRPWVDAAREAGVYVVLDLQPGRTDFLTQAKLYAELLKQPHVGLALDPEWRLRPGERHMVQIGSVSAAEVNATAAWLAALTREHKLPQKVLMLHQFRLDMITNRAALITDHDELRVVIHADGFGTAGQKFDTWRALHIKAPPNVWWGWKNFYDEDRPTFTPRQTYAVSPAPVFVSYQ